ncbi:hypothetical protein [Photobacterium chitinilyticum]|uniref:hypothetical protein n=1 Tax=Photobacterium chitinilyticum TaxID=2485123 RepID=UPI001F45552B|nr:hypothetical protein [Photobacterium chitinilyticum]
MDCNVSFSEQLETQTCSQHHKTQLMGGVFCKRKEQAFQPHYEVSILILDKPVLRERAC